MSFPAYPAYKYSGVEWLGAVPTYWESWKISHAFGELGSGTTPPTTEAEWYDNGTVPWVTTGELRESVVLETKKLLAPTALSAFSALRLHPAGSLAIAMYGATIGRLGILGVDATTNQACCLLTRPNKLHVKFTFYWLLVFRKSIIDLYASGGGQPNINQEIIANLKVPAPGVPEQTQIARFLDHETARIDALIEEQQRLIELLKEKRQAVISHAVTKGLDPTVPMKDSGVEWLGEVPAHWGFKQSKYLFEFVTSGSRGWAEYYSDEGDLFFRITNLTRDSIEPKLASLQYVTPPKNAEGERSRVRRDDILISITADLGSVCVANDEVAGSYVSQHVALARPMRKTVFSRWLAYFVLSAKCKDQLVGAGYGGTKVQLSLDDIRSFWVSMPPYDEQVSLAAFLDKEIQAFDGLITEAAIGVELLSERRSALISAAVTGKIDVRGWQPPANTPAPEPVVAEAH
jgi:type I restriction enzyme S subunit